MRSFFICVLMVFSMTVVYGQRAKKSKKSKEKTTNQPTSLNPGLPEPQNYEPPRKSKGSAKSGMTSYNAEKNYYDRVEKVAKERKKAEKELAKPQYSDPMYFGHKKPPRKRPPGKMKFCKVCGLRH